MSVQVATVINYKGFRLVSIHLMCRFKLDKGYNLLTMFEFQYILCVGSSLGQDADAAGQLSFNTSYVSVQVIPLVPLGVATQFQYILCVGSSSSI